MRYQTEVGWHEVRATLIVGADGRGSRVRRLVGFTPKKTSPPMNVLWFRLPREPGDPEIAMGRLGGGHILIQLNRFAHWPVGYVIPKGGYPELRASGIGGLRRAVTDLASEPAGRVEHLEGWQQVSLLSVESSRCPRWYRPGSLLIGDAAHVMSPVGDVGINYAIQDAVVAANVLAGPLLEGRLRLRHLRSVQLRREAPARVMQGLQALIQRRILAPVLRSDASPVPPKALRLLTRTPVLRDILAFGVWPVRVRGGEEPWTSGEAATRFRRPPGRASRRAG